MSLCVHSQGREEKIREKLLIEDRRPVGGSVFSDLPTLNDGSLSEAEMLKQSLIYTGWAVAAGGFRYLVSVRNSTVLKLSEVSRWFQ